MRQMLLVFALVLAMRLPFLDHPIQGDDTFYLACAQHALIDPLHPHDFRMQAIGIEVDMRGFPHPPGNSWFLAGLLRIFGDVREVPFHAAYLPFSFGAAAAMLSLARRFSVTPLWATLLFCASPVFVVNGNSLESDVPFVCFFLGAMALWAAGVEEESRWKLAAGALAAGAATMISYQGVILTALFSLYLWRRRPAWRTAFAAALAPVAVFAAWQIWGRISSGAAPAEVLSGHFQTHGLQALPRKIHNAGALVAHLGWIVSPLAMPWPVLGGAVFAWIDTSPLFWLPFGCGLYLLARAAGGWRDFLCAWIAIFFAMAVAVFFAGSARYLLPAAAPVAILAANRIAGQRWRLAAAFGTQMALGLALAWSNQDHWRAYRDFTAAHRAAIEARRTWVDTEWGLRFYAESLGALPVQRNQPVRPGDNILSSRLGEPPAVTTGGGAPAPVSSVEVIPRLPFRLFAEGSRSAYSSGTGWRVFDISGAPADRVTLSTVVERKPARSFLRMDDPEAPTQIVTGVYQLEENAWRWTAGKAILLLKAPPAPSRLEAEFRVHDLGAGMRVRMLADGRLVAEQTYARGGQYKLGPAGTVTAQGTSTAVTLVADPPIRAPGDSRELGIVLLSVGYVDEAR